TTNEAEMGVCSRGPVKRDYLTGNPLRFFRCNGKCLDGPIYFSFCVGNRFASLSRHQAGKFLTSVIEPARDLLQGMIASVGRQGSHWDSSVDRRLDRCCGIDRTCVRYLGEQPSCEWIVYGNNRLPVPPQTSNQKWTWFLHERCPVNDEDLVSGLNRFRRSRFGA